MTWLVVVDGLVGSRWSSLTPQKLLRPLGIGNDWISTGEFTCKEERDFIGLLLVIENGVQTSENLYGSSLAFTCVYTVFVRKQFWNSTASMKTMLSMTVCFVFIPSRYYPLRFSMIQCIEQNFKKHNHDFHCSLHDLRDCLYAYLHD